MLLSIGCSCSTLHWAKCMPPGVIMSGPGPSDYCSTYVDKYGLKHDSEQCGVKYCCGDCNQRYCCSDWSYRITQEERNMTIFYFHPYFVFLFYCSSLSKSRRTALILGTVLGVLLPLLFCVILFVCCEAHCCVIYKCRKRWRPRPNCSTGKMHCISKVYILSVAVTTTIVHSPEQSVGPSGYQPSCPSEPSCPGQPTYPGYQPVLEI
uniref:Shisa N-terminal domain-containing protein n=1 Tax=Salarias fasciatus TaxID=181472 RepID=A0A672IAI1_SALFA